MCLFFLFGSIILLNAFKKGGVPDDGHGTAYAYG